ncbi:MAG: hypothetical protein ABMB14_21035 [Myxococcota bacterium]
MRSLPKLDDLIGEQPSVYHHPPDDHLFVAGPPGSGKTSLAVLRATFLTHLPRRVVLITRNRMLSSLTRQLGAGVFVTSTMNSFVSRDHSQRLGRFAPQPDARYEYDWVQIYHSYEAAGIKPALDHLVIDEGQNLPGQFFTWAMRFGARTLTVFADENQATSKQTATLHDIRHAGLPRPIRLTDNHRNTEEIARLAEYFHRGAVLPPALVRRGRGGELPRLVRVNSGKALAGIVATRFRNRREAIGVVVGSKEHVNALHGMLLIELPGIRVDAYTSDTPPAGEQQIRILEPGVTVLTSESVIGLEFDTVFLHDLRSLPCLTPADSRKMYMMCARARDILVLVDGPEYLSSAQYASLPDGTLLER